MYLWLLWYISVRLNVVHYNKKFSSAKCPYYHTLISWTFSSLFVYFFFFEFLQQLTDIVTGPKDKIKDSWIWFTSDGQIGDISDDVAPVGVKPLNPNKSPSIFKHKTNVNGSPLKNIICFTLQQWEEVSSGLSHLGLLFMML